MSNSPNSPFAPDPQVIDPAALAKVAAALWPLAAHPFREVGTVGNLMVKGIPSAPWLNSCGVYALVIPPDYSFHLLDAKTIHEAQNVLSPQPFDRLQARWVANSRVIFIGIAGNTIVRSLRAQLKTLVRHAAGDTTDRGPHRDGEWIWQLSGYQTFTVMALPTADPPAPKQLEQTLLEQFVKRNGKVPFGNRPTHGLGDIRVAASRPVAPAAEVYSPSPRPQNTPSPLISTGRVMNPPTPPSFTTPPAPQSPLSFLSSTMRPDTDSEFTKPVVRQAIDGALARAQFAIVREVLRSAPPETTMREMAVSLQNHGLADAFLDITIGELRTLDGGLKPTDNTGHDESDFDDEDDDAGYETGPRRTTMSRIALDEAITTLFKKSPCWRAEDVRHELGVSPSQIRASMKRLVEAGHIRIEGERRSTQYIWVR